jgi:ligand-binding sensor domain-containing protein
MFKNPMSLYAKTTLIFLLLLLANVQCNLGFGQFERFKTYDVSDGICHRFIYTINQDKNGFIWLGTSEGLCRFDGFEFESFSSIDSLSNDVVNTSFIDTFGDLWFGFNNGLILRWDGTRATKYSLPVETSSAISAISQTVNGEIFISTLNKGCFIISSDDNA